MVVELGIVFEYPMKMFIIQHKDFIEALFTNRSYPVWCKYSIQNNPVDLAGSPAVSRRTRTRDFFSAIDEQLGVKSRLLRLFCSKITILL